MQILSVTNVKHSNPKKQISFGNFSGLYADKNLGELKAIANLRRAEQGSYAFRQAYYLVEENTMAAENILLDASEIIFKRPEERPSYKCSMRTWRNGLIPSQISNLLRRRFIKVTALVEDGLQIITLPKGLKTREKACRIIEQSPQIENEREIIGQNLTNSPDLLYEQVVKMLTNPDLHDIEIRKERFY